MTVHFQAPAAIANVPPRHPSPMRPQAIEVWTPFSFLGGIALALLTWPRQAVAVPATVRRPHA